MKKIDFLGDEIELFTHNPLVGEMAPCFKAMNEQFDIVELSDFKGYKVLISSFPSIDTPVCSLQAKQFNKKVEQIANLKAISISTDLPFAQKRFCTAENIENMINLSDANFLEFSMRYGLLIEKLRLTARAVIILDANHIIRYFDIVDDISKEPDYDKALDVASKL